MDPYLIIAAQGDRRVPLTRKQHWTLGRSRTCDVVIDDQWISRGHAMLQRMDGGEFYLVDFGSKNGSFVNGRRVSTPVRLSDGDRLRLGEVRVEFHCPPPAGPLPPAALQQSTALTAARRQRRMITVLVVDIRDFTGLTRRLGEDRLSEVIGSFFHRTGEVIRRHGSWVDKYIGDALMAVWFHDGDDGSGGGGGGVEVGDPRIGRTFEALCAIHGVTADLSREFALAEPLRIGAGVNTGYATVGDTGSRDRADYTALGDTVNAAFRLESATKEIGRDVVIGQTTHDGILRHRGVGAPPPPPFTPHTVRLKGYDGETVAYGCSFADLDAWLAGWRRPAAAPRPPAARGGG